MKKWRMGKSAARACNAGSMANVGYAVPTMEKLNTPHSEHILIAIRIDGNRPNINTPNPCAAITLSVPRLMIDHQPPGCGNCSMPNV